MCNQNACQYECPSGYFIIEGTSCASNCGCGTQCGCFHNCCNHSCCCDCEPCCAPYPPLPTGLSFKKTNAVTGLPLAGAEFTVRQNGAFISSAVSDTHGHVYLGALAAGTYQMTETMVPAGYVTNNTVYTVVVGADGSVTLNGTPSHYFSVANEPIFVR